MKPYWSEEPCAVCNGPHATTDPKIRVCSDCYEKMYEWIAKKCNPLWDSARMNSWEEYERATAILYPKWSIEFVLPLTKKGQWGGKVLRLAAKIVCGNS